MDVVTGFIWLTVFIAIYGTFIGLGWLIHTLLVSKFGKSFLPNDYFKTESEAWKKW